MGRPMLSMFSAASRCAPRLASAAIARTSPFVATTSPPMSTMVVRRTLHLGVVLAATAAAVQQQCSVQTQASSQREEADWRQDENGLWWHGETDGPYVQSDSTSAPPLSPSSHSVSPASGKFKKIPFTASEILPVARALAIECNVAALSTIAEIGTGQLFPRSRSVSTRHYISEDFEVSIATKIFTRKVEELRANPHCSFLWKYESDEKKTTGGWILAIGEAKVVPHANVGKGPEVDGHDKAKIVFTPHRLEVQDYPNHILAFGHDKWRCSILERKEGEWVKLQ